MQDLYIPKMSKIEIHQRILNHPWPILVGLMLISIPIFIAGPDVMATNDLKEIIGFSTAMVLGLATFIFAMSMKSHVELHENAVHYKDTVFARKLKTLSLEEIKNFSIEKYGFFKFKGLGYKRDFKGNKFIIMRMGKVLQIETKQGTKLVFGINDAGKVKRFIDKNWGENPS